MVNPEQRQPQQEILESNAEQKELIDKFADFAPTVDQIEHRDVAQRLVDEINNISSEFEQAVSTANSEQNPALKLQGVAHHLKMRIWNLFHTRNPHGGVIPIDLEREQWSITKEFLSGIKRFNQQIRTAKQQFGAQIEEYEEYYLLQIQEAKAISEGRILTHTASTETMYQVLERGDLSSISEQETKYKASKRTHEAPNPEMGKTETHDVCFNIDSVYRNFSDDEAWVKTGQRIRSNLVLLLSENHILDHRQYVDIDGRHVFDEQYHGDIPDSRGLNIDLRSTPFMLLVSETEKDNLIRFLREKSAFKEILASMNEDQQTQWIESRLITAPSVSNFKFTPEIKNRFFVGTNQSPKNGYVELTDTQATFKAGVAKTRRFISS